MDTSEQRYMAKHALYIPLKRAFAQDDMGGPDREVALTGRVAEDILTYGPVEKLVVHDTPAWRETVKDSTIGNRIQLISNADIQRWEEIASEVLRPVSEVMVPRRGKPGTNQPGWGPEFGYRALHTVLVGFQIGTAFKCAIGTDWMLFERALKSTMLAKNRVSGGLKMERLASIERVLRSYTEVHVAGVMSNEAPIPASEIHAFLNSDPATAMARSKHALGWPNVPIAARIEDTVKAARRLVKKTHLVPLSLSWETFRLVANVESPKAIDALALIVNLLGASSDNREVLDMYMPPHFNDMIAPPYFKVGRRYSGGALGLGALEIERYGWEKPWVMGGYGLPGGIPIFNVQG